MDLGQQLVGTLGEQARFPVQRQRAGFDGCGPDDSGGFALRLQQPRAQQKQQPFRITLAIGVEVEVSTIQRDGGIVDRPDREVHLGQQGIPGRDAGTRRVQQVGGDQTLSLGDDRSGRIAVFAGQRN